MQSKNKVIMAAAGAGKTWGICNNVINISTDKKILITTYTNKGIDAIINEYKKQNFGVIDKNVSIKTWFQFLLSDMVKPYQSYILKDYNQVESIDFSKTYKFVNYTKKGTKERYINSHNDVYSNFISELVIECNRKSGGKVIRRLSEVYSHIFIDEVQDLAGDDLNILELLIHSSITVCFVGDYKQATYTTHNTKKNKKLSGINVVNCFEILSKQKKLSINYICNSRRFNRDICEFANEIFPYGTKIATAVFALITCGCFYQIA